MSSIHPNDLKPHSASSSCLTCDRWNETAPEYERDMNILLTAQVETVIPTGSSTFGGDTAIAPGIATWLDLGNWFSLNSQICVEHGFDTDETELVYGFALVKSFGENHADTHHKNDHHAFKWIRPQRLVACAGRPHRLAIRGRGNPFPQHRTNTKSPVNRRRDHPGWLLKGNRYAHSLLSEDLHIPPQSHPCFTRCLRTSRNEHKTKIFGVMFRMSRLLPRDERLAMRRRLGSGNGSCTCVV